MASDGRIRFSACAILLAAALAGCNTDGTGAPGLFAQAGAPAAPAETAAAEEAPPLTRPEAAKQCWMATEKGRKDISLDKRADIVTKCIDDKLKAAADAAAVAKSPPQTPAPKTPAQSNS